MRFRVEVDRVWLKGVLILILLLLVIVFPMSIVTFILLSAAGQGDKSCDHDQVRQEDHLRNSRTIMTISRIKPSVPPPIQI